MNFSKDSTPDLQRLALAIELALVNDGDERLNSEVAHISQVFDDGEPTCMLRIDGSFDLFSVLVRAFDHYDSIDA